MEEIQKSCHVRNRSNCILNINKKRPGWPGMVVGAVIFLQKADIGKKIRFVSINTRSQVEKVKETEFAFVEERKC